MEAQQYTRRDLLFVAEQAAEAAAKKTVEELDKASREKEKRHSPVSWCKEMLREYRRMKISQKEEIALTAAEGIEMRWRYLEDLMGGPDRAQITEEAAYTREKKLQYRQYKIQQVEAAMAMYKRECETAGKSEAMRRYRAVDMLHIQEKGKTVQEIAALEGVSDKAIYKDLGTAYKALAVYMISV